MPHFIMLTRVAPGALRSPRSIEALERETMDRIRSACPAVEWLQSYALLGRYDYLDIFDAPDIDTATKVSAIVRSFGHAHAEIWGATEWKRYKEMVHHLPGLEE